MRPRWVVVPLVGGLGSLLVLGWELGEYWLFISHGKEAGGAYRDTLGDETLGSSGETARRAAGRLVDEPGSEKTLIG